MMRLNIGEEVATEVVLSRKLGGNEVKNNVARFF
jgi:hypothetical protein